MRQCVRTCASPHPPPLPVLYIRGHDDVRFRRMPRCVTRAAPIANLPQRNAPVTRRLWYTAVAVIKGHGTWEKRERRERRVAGGHAGACARVCLVASPQHHVCGLSVSHTHTHTHTPLSRDNTCGRRQTQPCSERCRGFCTSAKHQK